MRVFKIAGFNVILLFVLLEITLRLVPGLVAPSLLIHFHPDIRARLASGHLPEESETVLIPRDDGGFPLRIWKPFVTIDLPFDDVGIVRKLPMDSLGFCNVPDAYRKTSIDLITIGDSFTWCLNVHPEETWTSQLAGRVNLNAYNLGKDGIGVYEYLQLLKRFGLKKHPRYVILNVYEGNDLRDAVKYHTYKSRDVTREPAAREARIFDTLYQLFEEGPFRRNSYTLNLVIATGSYVTRKLTPTPDFHYTLVSGAVHIPFNVQNVDLDEVKTARKLVDGDIRMDVLDEALTEFFHLARMHRFKPIVTYTPSAYTAYTRYVRFKDPHLATLMNTYSHRQRAYLSRAIKRRGGVFVDLTPRLQAAAPKHLKADHLLYFPTNLHLTQAGHRVIADTLAAVMIGRNVRPHQATR